MLGARRSQNSHRPSILALTRQALPALRLKYGKENLSAPRRLYPRARRKDAARRRSSPPARKSRSRMDARATAAKGRHRRGGRVACPAGNCSTPSPRPIGARCWAAARGRVAVEAASAFGWERYVGTADAVVGMQQLRRFGAGRRSLQAFRHHRRSGRRLGQEKSLEGERSCPVRVAINGFGRIGRLVLRGILESGRDGHRGRRHQRSGPGRDQRPSAALRHRAWHVSRRGEDAGRRHRCRPRLDEGDRRARSGKAALGRAQGRCGAGMHRPLHRSRKGRGASEGRRQARADLGTRPPMPI